jgi:hypothetical protein
MVYGLFRVIQKERNGVGVASPIRVNFSISLKKAFLSGLIQPARQTEQKKDLRIGSATPYPFR